eukprot:5909739-Prymnesium_polylepis.2
MLEVKGQRRALDVNIARVDEEGFAHGEPQLTDEHEGHAEPERGHPDGSDKTGGARHHETEEAAGCDTATVMNRQLELKRVVSLQKFCGHIDAQ